MKKYIYKMLPFVLMFVFVFQLNVFATDTVDVPLYPCTNYDSYYADMISLGISQYKNDTGYDGKVFCYADLVNVDSASLHRLDFFIAPLDSSYFTYTTSSVTFYNDGGISQYYLYASGGVANYFDAQYKGSIASVVLSDNSSNKNLVIYVSQDITASLTDEKTLFYKSPAPLYVEENSNEYPLNYDFYEHLKEFEEFVDYSDSTQEYVDSVANSKNDFVANENSPNDSLFADILSAMTGISNVNNQIVQQISAQLQQFANGMFLPFANFCLNFLRDIWDSVNGIADDFSQMIEFANSLHELGMSNGTFSVSTFLSNSTSLLFVPEENYLNDKIDSVVLEKFGFLSVGYAFMDSIKSVINQASTTAPVIITDTYVWNDITIPAFTISFEWYDDFKPYVDPIVSAFVWLWFVWHVVTNFPNLIHGRSLLSGYKALNEHMTEVSDKEKIAINYGWK